MALTKRMDGRAVCIGMAAGAVGGLLGSWTMNQFQALVTRFEKSKTSSNQPGQKDEPATLKAAEKVTEAAGRRPLNRKEKKITEPLVHYVFGTLVGALYGGLAEAAPVTKLGAGMAYGAAVWLIADEIAVPAAGLSKPSTQTPLPKHLEALGAHLVYGLTTNGMLRLARAIA